ncbi:MAG: DUF3499 family protein [Microthrixaceae bacterium]
MSRSCARPGCGHPAVATLSYAYRDSIVWLEELSPEAHPMVHDLCRLHAANVRVPLGWELQDHWSATQTGDLAAADAARPGQLDLIGA